jgi:TM2 domain-containing membrane protein YozV
VSQEWYYSVDGGREGPVSAADLKKLAEAGKIKPGDLVWKDGMSDWVQAKSIKGLFGGGKTGEQPAAQPVAAAEEERPSARGRPRDEEDEDRPRRRRDEDDEDEDRPRSRRREDDDEEEDGPVRRRRDEDDEDEDRPRRRRSRVPEDTSSKKMVAGLLGILLGGWGIHKFYLGMTGAGVLQIVITFVTCGIGGIIGLIEGIIYLTKSDEDFHQTYVVEQKNWF